MSNGEGWLMISFHSVRMFGQAWRLLDCRALFTMPP